MKRLVLALPLIASCSGCLTRPGFVPVPSHVFSRFEALREPRSDLSVGALWIDTYGPTGDGAAPDNLVTTKSLTGVTFDNGFQASLTLGLLKFLDLDPSYASKMTAHFGDLSIVRVKDMAKLAGPSEQPRIYEALKAGSVTITAIGSVGLDIENRAISQHLPVFGRGTSAIAKSFTIDGRDMFIAFEVASLRHTSSRTSVTRLAPGQTKRVIVGPADLSLATGKAANGNCSTATLNLQETKDFGKAPIANVGLKSGDSKPLTIPVADGQGGLFSAVEIVDASTPVSGPCVVSVHLRLTGQRVERASPRQPKEF